MDSEYTLITSRCILRELAGEVYLGDELISDRAGVLLALIVALFSLIFFEYAGYYMNDFDNAPGIEWHLVAFALPFVVFPIVWLFTALVWQRKYRRYKLVGNKVFVRAKLDRIMICDVISVTDLRIYKGVATIGPSHSACDVSFIGSNRLPIQAWIIIYILCDSEYIINNVHILKSLEIPIAEGDAPMGIKIA